MSLCQFNLLTDIQLTAQRSAFPFRGRTGFISGCAWSLLGAQALSSCEERRLLLGVLIAAPPLLQGAGSREPGLRGPRVWAQGCRGFRSCGRRLSCSAVCGIFPNQGLNSCPLNPKGTVPLGKSNDFLK